jgi:nitrite reductase (NADH) large subunit
VRYGIVGGGVAGATAAQAVARADSAGEIDLFTEEAYPYYRRPQLWAFIAGEIDEDALYFRKEEWYAEKGIRLRLSAVVTAVDAAGHRLSLADGSEEAYDRLLVATGARPFVPPIEGAGMEGVFSLRTLEDAQTIKEYAQQVTNAIVVGGGLLGLETARALRTAGLDVTVVEFFTHLLPRQLDVEGAAVLQALLEEQGLRVVTGGRTEAVVGDGRASGIRLQGGHQVAGGLVLFSTGIRSRVELAQAAGLETNRGIVVDHHLRTSAEDVYAAGDVAEYRGQVYGIIPPAIEQARVAAANLVEPGSATYAGSVPSTTLKVAGAELTTIGDGLATGKEFVVLRHMDLPARHYRKLVLHDGRIVGAILMNDRERSRTVGQLIQQGTDVGASVDLLIDDRFDLATLLH